MKVAPSILSADFARLGEEVEEIKNAGAEYAHFDVMDGTFVPNISIGIPVLKSLRKASDIFIDVHLMIDRPVRYVRQFCEAGADLVNFHIESDTQENILEAISIAKSLGKKTGVTLKPKTEAEEVLPFLPYVDLVLVMTVEPGFGGQSFMADMMPKVKALREIIEKEQLSVNIQVDGGIDKNTIGTAAEAGANIFVAGSALFKQEDYCKAVEELRAAAL